MAPIMSIHERMDLYSEQSSATTTGQSSTASMSKSELSSMSSGGQSLFGPVSMPELPTWSSTISPAQSLPVSHTSSLSFDTSNQHPMPSSSPMHIGNTAMGLAAHRPSLEELLQLVGELNDSMYVAAAQFARSSHGLEIQLWLCAVLLGVLSLLFLLALPTRGALRRTSYRRSRNGLSAADDEMVNAIASELRRISRGPEHEK
jgi:hypothetical protein